MKQYPGHVLKKVLKDDSPTKVRSSSRDYGPNQMWVQQDMQITEEEVTNDPLTVDAKGRSSKIREVQSQLTEKYTDKASDYKEIQE